MCSKKTDTDLSLAEQVNMEKEMGTYLVRCTTVKELKLFWAVVDRGISQGKQEYFWLSGLAAYFLLHQLCWWLFMQLYYGILDQEVDTVQDPSNNRRRRNEQLFLELSNPILLEISICVLCP